MRKSDPIGRKTKAQLGLEANASKNKKDVNKYKKCMNPIRH